MGVARQLEDCERLAERKGWVIVERFVDDDVSAWSGKRRPEYARLLELSTGVIDGLLVYRPRPAAPAAEGVGGLYRPVRAAASDERRLGERRY